MRCLYFTAPYCGACKAIRETAIGPLRSRGYPVEEIDCMRRPHVAERYGVRKVPTTIVLDDFGEVYSRHVLSVTPDILEADMGGDPRRARSKDPPVSAKRLA